MIYSELSSDIVRRAQNFHLFLKLLTLSSLLRSCSNKPPGLNFSKNFLSNDQVHLKKKLIVVFYFRAATANFGALLLK